MSPWKITESEEKEEEKSKNQEFTYQNLIMENSEFGILNLQTQQNSNLENLEIETPNIQPLPNQNNQNFDLINQPDLPPIIVINPLPVEPIGQPLQQPHQQIQQPLISLQQPPQSNLDPMAYALIAKLKKFTGKENDTQVWLNDMKKTIAANGWNDTRAMLANTFTTIKQGENKAVTTYLEHFHRNLHKIQAIDPNYFTVAQILNQFIRGLCSSILQRVCPMYLINLQVTITNARDFKATELEANHAQAINLVMNGSSELDSKLKQFSNSINQKLEEYLADNRAIYQPSQRCNNSRNVNHFQNQLCLSSLTNQQVIPSELLIYDVAATLSTTSISNANLSTNDTSNLSATATIHLSAAAPAKIDPTKLEINLGTGYAQNPNFQNYLNLLVTPEDAQPNNLETNQYSTLTSNIPPATITENESLDAIFLFKLKEPSIMPLFSGAALEEKPITAIYTDAKVDSHSIKLILDSGSAGSIITKQLMDQLGCQVDCTASTRIITANRATKTLIGEIDNFPFKVNGIITLIKVLVIEATQYQTLVGNNWLSKTNAILD
ncbi:hypothetical protein G9A89_011193 [Geosiphon pyriformis]|nr:hypothetical protein G9A89_011193 [Geosiphon pyriformis]